MPAIEHRNEEQKFKKNFEQKLSPQRVQFQRQEIKSTSSQQQLRIVYALGVVENLLQFHTHHAFANTPPELTVNS